MDDLLLTIIVSVLLGTILSASIILVRNCIKRKSITSNKQKTTKDIKTKNEKTTNKKEEKTEKLIKTTPHSGSQDDTKNSPKISKNQTKNVENKQKIDQKPASKSISKPKPIPPPPPPPPLPANNPIKPVDEFRLKGNKAYKYHDYREAIQFYNEAIKLDPNNAILYANRAASYNGLGLYHAGTSDGQKAVDLDPSYIKGYIRLGAALEGNLNWNEALKVYQNALKLNPNDIAISKRIDEIKKRIENPDSLEAIIGPEMAKKIHMSPLLHDNYGNPVFLDMVKDITKNAHNMSKYTGQPMYEEFMKIFMMG